MASQLNISNVEEYLEKAVLEINPDLDLREGTAMRDFLIKPLTTFLQPLIEEMVRIANSQSLLNATTISEPDMDELVANVFVTRRGGSNATGTVRIFLSSASNSIEVQLGTIFTTTTGLRFLAAQRVFITRQALELNLDGNFYYVDVSVTAEFPGSEYNVAAGQINGMAVQPVNFVRVTNINKVETGVDREDNEELGDRAKVAITVRDLVSEPGIITQLLENFTSIVQIQPIGFGDAEMIRDIVTTDGTFLQIGGIQYDPASGTSIGGMVDAYIKPVGRTQEEYIVASSTEFMALREQEFDDPAPAPNYQYLTGTKRPVIDIVEIEELDSVNLTPTGIFLQRGLDYEVTVDNPALTYSTREKKEIHIIEPLFLAKPLAVRYLHSEDVVAAQDFIGSNTNRTVSADLLAKHAVPVFVDMTIAVKQPTTITTTAQDYVDAVSAFINDRELGEDLEASDIVDAIYDVNSSSNRIKVTLPFDMNIEENFVDGTITPSSSQDLIEIDRTKVYIARDIVITLTTV